MAQKLKKGKAFSREEKADEKSSPFIFDNTNLKARKLKRKNTSDNINISLNDISHLWFNESE